MKNRPGWYTDEYDTAWNRVKGAFKNDWEQTKHDFGVDTARDLDQDVDDTAKQALGTRDAFENHEQAFRFGYAAQRQFGSQYRTWNTDLETRLRSDYGAEFDRDRLYIQQAYDFRYPTVTAGIGSEERPEERR